MKKNKPKKVKKKVDYVKCVWGMLCSVSSNDQEKNNISLFNIIDQFNLPKQYFIAQAENKSDKPVLCAITHELVLSFRRTLSLNIHNTEIPFDVKIKNIDPTGKIIEEMFFQLNFPSAIKRLRVGIPKIGIIATKPGDYIYQIEIRQDASIDFNKILEIPFEVTEALEKVQVPAT